MDDFKEAADAGPEAEGLIVGMQKIQTRELQILRGVEHRKGVAGRRYQLYRTLGIRIANFFALTMHRPENDIAESAAPFYETQILASGNHDYLVAICFFNEGERLARQLRKFPHLDNRDFDLLLADDGSTDGGAQPEGACAVLRLPCNMGLSTNIRAVLDWYAREGRYQGLILMNGNDKDDPEAIPRFISALRNGCDYVQGSRFLPGGSARGTPILRYLAIRLIHAPLFSLAARRYVSDTTNGFRAFSSRFLGDSRVHAQQKCFRHYEIEPYLAWKAIRLGYATCEIPVTRIYPSGTQAQSFTKIRSLRMHAKLVWPLLRLLANPYR